MTTKITDYTSQSQSSKNYYSLEITTTQSCNMRCTYCFEGAELENDKKAIDVKIVIQKVRELLDSKSFLERFNGIVINFWGGEPTLNYKYCQTIIEAFKNDSVDFFFYTNGLVYDNIYKIINYSQLHNIDLNRIRFQISYDGIWNDETRVIETKRTKEALGTAEKVLSNFEKLKEVYPYLHISLKSTLPVEKLCSNNYDLVNNWYHFKELFLKFGEAVKYSPTLEYTQNYSLSSEQIYNAEMQFLKIAKLEIEFFMINKRHLFSWFDVKDRSLCSAGINIGNLDLDGNLSVCHGALYSDDKSELLHGNILEKDDTFSNQVLNMHAIHNSVLSFSTHKSSVSNSKHICDGCEATVCYQCPTVNFSNSKKETYQEKYHDPKTDLCSIYKNFGVISKTVYKFLNTSSIGSLNSVKK